MIEKVSPDTPNYEQVVKLGDANSATLGFLPYEAIRQAAVEGRVLAFVENDKVKGYALYGVRVRTGDISLTHLCVGKDQRGRGIARELVEGIIERNQHRAGIRLSCRKDYDANAMWPKLGFQRLGEKPGRSRAGHLLVAWWRPIAAQTLFEEAEREDARLLVAIDTNVLLDIFERRDVPASRALRADWVDEAAELAVTAQSRSELSDRDPKGEDFESTLGEFRELAPSKKAWHAELQSLQDDPAVARVEGNDLHVVAQASAGGAAYLVSRDADLLQQAERIEQLIGLNIVDPDDFLLRLQGLGGEHGRKARTIAASGMSFSAILKIPSNSELSVFCQHGIGERPTDLRARLSIVTAHPSGRIVQLATDSGEPLALGAVYRDQTQAIITALRCTAGAQSYAAVRQMVHHLRAVVAEDGQATIVVDDQTRSPVDSALRDEGFRPEGSAWRAVVRAGVFGPGDPLPQELEQVGWDRLNAHLVRDYERFAWPSKVFSGIVTSYMVPIMPEYARVILGYEDPQGRLFEPNLLAAASRDNVYYMSPFPLEAPARIIWWVSGGGSLGGVRAMSWLDEVEKGDPSHLYAKYRNFGVLDERQVRDTASLSKSGHLQSTAMLFSQTEIFSEPVPIDRSRELCDSMNQEGFFVTTRKIDENTIRRFYEEGMKSSDDRVQRF